ncbi:MAG TPA: glycosyltransferase [Bryobacteraceae bacterium]|nr:glycosyltransferase [Bryobacteraceae bacterium]
MRVAFFTDSFEEANGVATLSRELCEFASREDLPLLCVHSGDRKQETHQGSVTTIELRRSPIAIPVDYELRCDLLLNRHRRWVTERVRDFKPDLVHITGPGDFGVLGFWVAHTLRVPLVASWHTNLHEYMRRRLEKWFAWLPAGWRDRVARTGENLSLNALLRFYRLPRFLMAPNESMIQLLRERIGRPAFLMPHGVDSDMFSPARREAGSGPFSIGYVGRLTPEKNVRLFADLEQSLVARGRRDFRLLLIGAGSESEWLRHNLQFVSLPGIVRGEALAQSFASMDVFVFPSRTDTFGLVLLEAMASGVPVIVDPETGRHVGIEHGEEGFLAADLEAVATSILRLMDNQALRRSMSAQARRFACSNSWCGVFHRVYEIYEQGMKECGLPRRA